MVKLVVKQPGFFVTLPKLGSFRSPFRIRIPESLIPLVEMELLKNGVKDFKLSKCYYSEEKEFIKKKIKKHVEKKEPESMSEVIERLKDIQSLVSKILSKDPIVREIVIQKGEHSPSMINRQPEIEEEIFIPRISERISIIDLSVKTTEKEDVSNQVELLSNLKQ